MMTPEQALALLDSAAAQYKGTRADHAALTQALEVFKRLMMERSTSQTEGVVKLASAPKWRQKRAAQGNS